MTGSRRFKQVDVFTDQLGSGNPVAVVLDGAGLSTEQMQSFASWTNLSETTFVLPPTSDDADYELRIFTPSEELPFAGHPTIGTCHAWLEAGGRPRSPGTIVQQCGLGLVTLRPIDGRLSFETPPCLRTGPVDPQTAAETLDALGLAAEDVAAMAWVDNGPAWIGVLVHDVQILRGLDPAWTSLDSKAGVAAITGGSPQLEVRAFFNAGGTREDPVTGSLNGSLAQWLVETARIEAPYVAAQGSALGRNGRVHITPGDGDSLWVGGDAVTGIEGTVNLP